MPPHPFNTALIVLILLLTASGAAAQTRLVTGTVYDQSMQFAMRGVSVLSASGAGTLTDSTGRYSVKLAKNDSIYFSYLGKETQKFAVSAIPVGYPFDMSLAVVIDSLPTAIVRSGSYRLDSLANRQEYRAIFDYQANYLTSTNSPRSGGVGVGLDIDMFFDGKKNRRMLAFRDRLKWEEQEKYVDHRFTKNVVRRVTGLQSPMLDSFMRYYRPGYDMIKSCETEYEFEKYILKWSQYFMTDRFRAYKLSGHAQGTTWHITYYASDSLVATAEIDSLMRSIDSSLSIYKPWSLISRFNDSDTGIAMDRHMKAIMEISFRVYRTTGGLSDPTVYPLVNLWGFGPEKPAKEKDPDSADIRQALGCVGLDKLRIDGDILRKDQSCVKLDPNGIAQGYTVDETAAFLEAKGITNYLVELGGEIVLKGKKYPGEQPISVGIESPSTDPLLGTSIEKVIYPQKGAITTSGSYRKFRTLFGRSPDSTRMTRPSIGRPATISHLIDPHTGYPFTTDLISVTVWAADGITADAYDNALMGMGLKKALAFMTKHPEMEAWFIYRDPGGAIKSTFTPGFKKAMR